MDYQLFELAEVEQTHGLPMVTLRQKLNRGEIEGVKVQRGKRQVWAITQNTLEYLLKRQELTPEEGDYQALHDEWLAEQRQGLYTKGSRPLKEKSIRTNKDALQKFWDLLGYKPNLKHMTAENLRAVIAALPIDREKRRDYTALKVKMKNALKSFFRFLVRKKLRPKSDLLVFDEITIQSTFQPVRTVVHEADLETLLAANEKWLTRRTAYDVQLTKVALLFMADGGLRRDEVVRLQLENIDMAKREFWAMDRKFYKNTWLGISKRLHAALVEWLAVYRPKTVEMTASTSKALIIKEDGRPLSGDGVYIRIKKLSLQAKVHAHPHAFRRSFATIRGSKGTMSVVQLQAALDHSDIKTTMGYIQEDQRNVVEAMKE